MPLCYNTDTKKEEHSSQTTTKEIATMYDWDSEIKKEAKEQKKRWNGKVITTGRQWAENASGSREVDNYESSRIWDAVRDYYDSRQWD